MITLDEFDAIIKAKLAYSAVMRELCGVVFDRFEGGLKYDEVRKLGIVAADFEDEVWEVVGPIIDELAIKAIGRAYPE